MRNEYYPTQWHWQNESRVLVHKTFAFISAIQNHTHTSIIDGVFLRKLLCSLNRVRNQSKQVTEGSHQEKFETHCQGWFPRLLECTYIFLKEFNNWLSQFGRLCLIFCIPCNPCTSALIREIGFRGMQYESVMKLSLIMRKRKCDMNDLFRQYLSFFRYLSTPQIHQNRFLLGNCFWLYF